MLFRDILYRKEVGADKTTYVKNQAYLDGDLFIGITKTYDNVSSLTDNSPDKSVARARVYTFVVDAKTHKLVANSGNRQSFSYKNVSKMPWLTKDGELATYPDVLEDPVWMCTVTKNQDGTYTWEKALDAQGLPQQVYIAKAIHENHLIGKQAVWNETTQKTEDQIIESAGTLDDLEARQVNA